MGGSYVIWGLIGLGVLAVLPFVLEARREVPDTAFAPGSMADLSQGRTHFRWIGPSHGPIIVAVHGLTTPSPVWEKIADGLAKLGYRTLVYDLYGRGFSDAPKGDHDRAFYLQQLDDLLEHQGITGQFVLMGYSMGGSIATTYAARSPSRLTRLFLVATAGLETNDSAFSKLCVKTPFLGDWLHALVRPMRSRWALFRSRKVASEVGGINELQRAETYRRGFAPAVLSSRRHMLAEFMIDDHRSIARSAIPVIAIWGEEDRVIPIRALGTLAQLNRETRQDVVQYADHGLPFTHGSKVVESIQQAMAGGH
ncbi:alpha/beta fold hydrolase [Thalassobium sp. R2A62]|jgi:pimeloyl-ACP methyl ester carboxylesterase|uniref:alpha/beta fold hydrolase n=1 Tax=Thalassobium sp. R2A62 TaxID=633131 RepID=UPI0001B1D0C5|nr:alpha/beta hydrolase [Thalassobium sp. R2A62]EET47147.1 alpha/beta hydrolase fold-containing protein [Thalassobium sp. R2A62]MDG1339926.1 alpha/beta hydrolase [Paracoccaceae bacterium]MDG2451679.1 alpha/beta hydrolase [Paracoccaceae bacterium]